MSHPRFCIVGAGNGGQAFAGHFAMLGCHVRLFDIDPRRIEELRTGRDGVRAAGAIQLAGAVQGAGVPAVLTADMGEAMATADVIMVVVPACYHESIAHRMAPHLVAGQMVVLNPGATGGALVVREVFRRVCSADVMNRVIVAETVTLLYACRAEPVGCVQVFAVKDSVGVAALPAQQGADVAGVLAGVLGKFEPLPNILHTTLNNVNAMAHPAPTLLNAGRIEGTGPFEYYHEGITPSIGRVVERLDKERLALGEAFGVKLPSLAEWLQHSYGVSGEDLRARFRANRGYAGIMAPGSLDTRYLFEDVPTGLVPLAMLAQAVGSRAPLMEGLVHLANAVAGRDFWQEGRSLDKLGLAGCACADLRRMMCG